MATKIKFTLLYFLAHLAPMLCVGAKNGRSASPRRGNAEHYGSKERCPEFGGRARLDTRATKLLVLLSLVAAMMSVAACGAQPEQAVQGSRQTEAQIEESVPTTEPEAGAVGQGEEPAAGQAETQEAEGPQEQHDQAAEAEEHPAEERAGDEHEHDEDPHEQAGSVELSAVELAPGEKLKVLATTNIVGDLVRNVGGDRIELTTMLPVGADPHTFAPTPRDAAAVADAQVVFINGLHLEEFLEELIENAGGQAPTVSLATNVKTRQFEVLAGEAHGHDEDNHEEEKHDEEAEEHDEDEEGHEHEEVEEGHEKEGDHGEDEHGHAHEGADPHIWMTPANAAVMVHNIESALSQLDPANAETYEANAEAYEAQLEELDAWVKSQIEQIPAENRELVTDHEALGYYADRYGLEIVGTVLPASNTGAEPSAQELAELQEAIQKFESKAVFVGTTVNPVLAKRVAEDTGIELVPLYTGSLGQAGSGVESYLDFIRYNTTAIVEALK